MKSKDLLYKIIIGAAVLVVACLCCLKVYELSSNTYETQTVYEQRVFDTIDADMFIIRDETLLTDNSAGVILPIALNGERVSRGSEIAAVFPNGATAENYSELKSLNNKLDVYKKLNSQLKLANVDLNRLSREIDRDFISILDAAYNNDYSGLSEKELSFAEKLSRKQISLEENVDCTEKITELENKIASINMMSAPTSVISAETSGYYVSKPDGYEGILTSDSIKELTAAQLDVALNAEKKEIPDNSLGKIISGYNWYVACILKSTDLTGYKEGSKISLVLGKDENDTVPAELYKLINVDKNKSIAVFKCNIMNETLSTLRIVKGKIVTGEFQGLKIKKEAVRVNEDGRVEVFVRRGNIVNLRSINAVYSDENYVYAKEPDDSTKLPHKHIKLYDEVIISGKELYDGMVIG